MSNIYRILQNTRVSTKRKFNWTIYIQSNSATLIECPNGKLEFLPVCVSVIFYSYIRCYLFMFASVSCAIISMCFSLKVHSIENNKSANHRIHNFNFISHQCFLSMWWNRAEAKPSQYYHLQLLVWRFE